MFAGKFLLQMVLHYPSQAVFKLNKLLTNTENFCKLDEMKKFLVLAAVLLIVFACDKVKNPIQNMNAFLPPASPACVTPHVVKTNTAISSYRKILVEDYTGHTCGYCPNAARQIETLFNTYKDSMIAISVHAGTTFAPPQLPDYPEDFRVSEGADWDNMLGMSGAGFPKVSVNRAQTPFPQGWNTLPSLVPANLHKPQTVKLDITTYLDTNSLLMNVKVHAKFLSALSNNPYLVLVITEDSIIANQHDYNPPASANICTSDPYLSCNYVFANVLRGSLSGSAGESLKTPPVAINDTLTKTYNCYKVSSFRGQKRDVKNMSLVAFVYDFTTKEILQAEKLSLK